MTTPKLRAHKRVIASRTTGPEERIEVIRSKLKQLDTGIEKHERILTRMKEDRTALLKEMNRLLRSRPVSVNVFD